MLGHASLQGRQMADGPKPLDGDDLAAVAVTYRNEARIDRHAVEQDRARTAFAFAAAFFCTREPERATQRVEQSSERRHVDVTLHAVDLERDLHCAASEFSHAANNRSGVRGR